MQPLVLDPHIIFSEFQMCRMALQALVSKCSLLPLLVSPTDRSAGFSDPPNSLYTMLDGMRRNSRGIGGMEIMGKVSGES